MTGNNKVTSRYWEKPTITTMMRSTQRACKPFSFMDLFIVAKMTDITESLDGLPVSPWMLVAAAL